MIEDVFLTIAVVFLVFPELLLVPLLLLGWLVMVVGDISFGLVEIAKEKNVIQILLALTLGPPVVFIHTLMSIAVAPYLAVLLWLWLADHEERRL